MPKKAFKCGPLSNLIEYSHIKTEVSQQNFSPFRVTMKSHCGAATVSLLLWVSLIRNGHAEGTPPLAVLTAGAEDGEPPLIVLTSPITKPVVSEAIEYETTEAGTTSDAESEVTVKPTQPTQAPDKTKPGLSLNALNGPQSYLQAQLLSMPEMWNSSPQLAPGPNFDATQLSRAPLYYPMPVYIPYPISFMQNYAPSLRMANPEDQVGAKFNEILAETLLKDSGLNLRKIWKDLSSNNIGNRPLPTKWRGKFRKTTTTTTTTSEAPPTTISTEPTKWRGKFRKTTTTTSEAPPATTSTGP
ncbi:uncharacterized protein LOC111073010 isoform X2 [Drosophila obscura]|uniref:uncharacterized protein LOC111073010 isoform X2 n=1 Tax=Drosophila obscura TaxID=7282 RepID=UPI001BB16514|nr:uncharacterized protein LOC111073010 isoform X2 [Drosophila obscura]